MSRVNLEISLGVLFVLITGTVLVMYGLNEKNRMDLYVKGQEAQSIEVGAVLFENNCTGCHGPQGLGIPGLCPPLNDRHFFTSRLSEVGWSGTLEDYIVATVSSGRLTSTRPDQYAGNGKPAMPAWSDQYGGPLREDQIRDIAKFILNWQATAMGQVELAQVTPEVTANDPVSRGKLVFQSSGCVGCHTIEGISTGTVGPNLTHIGTDAAKMKPGMSAQDYIHESIVNPNAFTTPGFQPNIMPQTFGQQLSQQQIDDLVAFLLSNQ